MVVTASVTTESREIKTAAKTTRRLRFSENSSTMVSHKTEEAMVRVQP